ncbi:MAG: RluA family pseudouridine synthase [Gemmiger sp.]
MLLTLSYTVPPEAEGQRLQTFLRAQGVTAGCIRAVKHQSGGFFSDGCPLHTDQPVHAGKQITFTLPPEQETQVAPQPVPFVLRYEDDFAAVLDKPAGLAVHPTFNHPDGTLANGWLYHLAQQGKTGVFRPVNRIDKNTSGLVLCAQNAFAAPLLAQSAQKCYLAVVQGELPLGKGAVRAPIARRGDSIIGRCVREDGKPSLTEYTTLCCAGGYSLLACYPVTGRTHQIRVHMAYLGHPLAGDSLYGGPMEKMARHALHCAVLRFRHPLTGELRVVRSPLPADLAALCRQTGLSCDLTAL